MSATATIVLLWLTFAGSHLLLSHVPVRSWLIARLGENPFRGLYSLVALGVFVPMVIFYFRHKHADGWLWRVPHTPATVWLVYVGMGVAFVLVVAALVRPSPAGVIPGDPRPRGAYRITRHPLLMGLGLFGLVHLVFNAARADVAFFGGFPVFALIGAMHQDRRKLTTDGARFRPFYEATPFVPFRGGGRLQGIRELLPVVLPLGVAVTVVVRWFHGSWFGG